MSPYFLDWVGEMGYFTYHWQIVEPLWQRRLSLEYYNTKASFSAAKALSSEIIYLIKINHHFPPTGQKRELLSRLNAASEDEEIMDPRLLNQPKEEQ